MTLREGQVDNIILREDFLVKKILLNKSQLSQEKNNTKREKLFEHQDKLVDFLMAESEKVRASKDIDRMKYMRDRIKAIS
ncbi:hypothetical protein N9U30_00405 [bacterium]|nr:hypothetical protein [bacterium]